MQIGLTLASRYRIDEVVDSPGLRRSYRGTDTQTGMAFGAVRLLASEERALSKLKDFRHAHVAKVFDLVTLEDGGILLIGEAVRGQSLEAYVREHLGEAHHTLVDGVRMVLRLADAVSHAHSAGAYHGSIGPWSVIAVPEGRPGPVLVFQGWGSGDSGFFPGGSRGESEPTEALDTWAIAALLYYVLVGSEPPPSGLSSVDEIKALGILDPPLTDALLIGLNADPNLRAQNLKPIKRDLARWFVEHAGDESVPPGSQSSVPPPLPSRVSSVTITGHENTTERGVSRTSVPPQPRRKKGLVALALGALALGLLGAWGFSMLAAPPAPKVVALPPPKVEPVATQKAIDLSEVPVMGDDQARTENKAATCVAGYLPKGAFGTAPQLDWLCTEKDPRAGAEKLRAAIVAGAVNAPSDAMRVFGRLGWYDMAAFAVVHAGCCAERPRLELPKSEKCDDMANALSELGTTIMASGDPTPALDSYANSVKCEIAAGRANEFKHSPLVDGGESSAFRELIKGVVQP